jgi:hypothetical protein
MFSLKTLAVLPLLTIPVVAACSVSTAEDTVARTEGLSAVTGGNLRLFDSCEPYPVQFTTSEDVSSFSGPDEFASFGDVVVPFTDPTGYLSAVIVGQDGTVIGLHADAGSSGSGVVSTTYARCVRDTSTSAASGPPKPPTCRICGPGHAYCVSGDLLSYASQFYASTCPPISAGPTQGPLHNTGDSCAPICQNSQDPYAAENCACCHQHLAQPSCYQ